MVIGIPKERKVQEYRVALTPQAVGVLVQHGHKVLVEKSAGLGSGITDQEFKNAGARIVRNEKELFKKSKLIVKVKEPIAEEYSLIKENHIIFSYLHIAADKKLVQALKKSKCRAIAFETVELPDGSLPLLAPMSRIAGRLSVQVGVHFLQKSKGGKGVLLSGAAGVRNGKVTVIGGGTVGYNAVLSALGLGADVTVIDIKQGVLEYYYDRFEGKVRTLPSYPEVIEKELKDSDLVVGAVLVTGAKAPKVITKKMISNMEKGSLFVDVAIDQGGCSETSRPTNHDSPVYKVNDVLHYCVTNMPSLVSKTSTYSLSNVILPYVLQVADGKIDEAPSILKGINIDNGDLLINLN
ncbi:MAG: alanine dehydrogenase [Candidatus Dadabacteria bacterium]|nr:MAG: alanine dehydrogenase [Candidatus Dadabacteria bacterium]